MTPRKPIRYAALLSFFVLVIFSSSYACANSRPGGLYQHGAPRSGHRAGVGRAEARNFKAGFVAKDDFPQKNKLYQAARSTYTGPRIDGMAWTPDTFVSLPTGFILDLSPVLNL
jgi:hypothetical protein